MSLAHALALLPQAPEGRQSIAGGVSPRRTSSCDKSPEGAAERAPNMPPVTHLSPLWGSECGHPSSGGLRPRLLTGAPAGASRSIDGSRSENLQSARSSPAAAGNPRSPGVAGASASDPQHSALILPFGPAADLAALKSLALWALRFSPMVAVDPPHGLLLDITGCERLFRGEENLLRLAVEALRGMGYRVRAAIADTIGAAWAIARGGREECAIVPPGQSYAALAMLRPWTLRIAPETVEQLDSLGVDQVEMLAMLPRASLPSRFGDDLLLRLDQALGRAPETLEPVRPPAEFAARISFEEPVVRRDILDMVMRKLLERLVVQLTAAGRGARRLELMLFRLQNTPAMRSATLCAPSRSSRHLIDLLSGHLEQLHGCGQVMGMELAAIETGAIKGTQGDFFDSAEVRAQEDSAELFDRLGARLGAACIVRPEPVESYWPERAWRAETVSQAPAGAEANSRGRKPPDHEASISKPRRGERRTAHDAAIAQSVAPPGLSTSNDAFRGLTPPAIGCRPSGASGWVGGAHKNPQSAIHNPQSSPRPLRLLSHPRPIQVMALVPDGPPIWFRSAGCEHRVRHAAGPERICAEWWKGEAGMRDYFCAQDEDGARFWIFRERVSGHWFLHGVFE